MDVFFPFFLSSWDGAVTRVYMLFWVVHQVWTQKKGGCRIFWGEKCLNLQQSAVPVACKKSKKYMHSRSSIWEALRNFQRNPSCWRRAVRFKRLLWEAGSYVSAAKCWGRCWGRCGYGCIFSIFSEQLGPRSARCILGGSRARVPPGHRAPSRTCEPDRGAPTAQAQRAAKMRVIFCIAETALAMRSASLGLIGALFFLAGAARGVLVCVHPPPPKMKVLRSG